jgi:membrane protein|tara:strand:+ start:1167 stop:2390 length:1224 start_codon:yes stop_codon:yes gene_type:complete
VKFITKVAATRQGENYFIFQEILSSFKRHNFLAVNASISFFTLFAFIPLILLILFFFSQWLSSSSLALEKLQNITALLLPEMSGRIMGEVRKVASTKASWGALWITILFLGSTPLTSALRSSFNNIFSAAKKHTYLKNKVRDLMAVTAIMVLLFIYTSINIYLVQASHFFTDYVPLIEKSLLTSALSFVLLVLVVSFFFKIFIPVKTYSQYIFYGALVTSLCWFGLSNAFSSFTSVSEYYGVFFGGMRNLFISLIWLYLNTAALLIGAEVIAAFHKKEILLIKALFNIDNIHRHPIHKKLMDYFGQRLKKDKIIFTAGDHDQRLFFVIEGEVGIVKEGRVVETIASGQYFGELSLLNKIPRVASAYVISDWARVIILPEKKMRQLLQEDNRIAMNFLKKMAQKLQVI